ncbi:MAG: hypothetical protein AAF614_28985 [Chloroflexota bacterium]
MNSVKVKQTVAAIWLAVALTFGGSILSNQFNIDTIPAAHACSTSGISGGGC